MEDARNAGDTIVRWDVDPNGQERVRSASDRNEALGAADPVLGNLVFNDSRHVGDGLHQADAVISFSAAAIANSGWRIVAISVTPRVNPLKVSDLD